MSSSVPHRCLRSAQSLSARELARLFEIGQRLVHDTAEGRAGTALAGRHLALLGPLDDDSTRALVEAAAALGAQVASVDARALDDAPAQRVPAVARMLGRLYDGVDCCGPAAARVDQLEAWSGVPVTNGLSDPAHPLRLLGDLMTMQAWTARPLRALRVELADAAAPQARALAELAALVALPLQQAVPVLAAVLAGDTAVPDDLPCDFTWNPGPSVAERLRLPRAEAQASRALALLADAQERLALQTLLVAAHA